MNTAIRFFKLYFVNFLISILGHYLFVQNIRELYNRNLSTGKTLCINFYIYKQTAVIDINKLNTIIFYVNIITKDSTDIIIFFCWKIS